jgi:hypothetical protein
METRVAKLLMTSACAAVVIALAAPASAEPTDPGVPPADSLDAVFVQALDRVGIQHPDDRQAVQTANNVCLRIHDGYSAAETEEALQEANPSLEHSHAAAFVKVARTVYCPGVGVGLLPGHPGQT